MGSDFSKHICCVTCGRCKKQEEANEETSETKPILHNSGEGSLCTNMQPSTAALQVSQLLSEEVQSLGQVRQPPACAAEENMETCSAADPMGMTEGWEAAWDPMDFLEASAEGETKREVQVLTPADKQQESQEVAITEEKIKPGPHVSEAQPVTHTGQNAEVVEDKEQCGEEVEAGSEGTPCAGITGHERNNLNLMEFSNETVAGQDSEIKSTGESIIGRDLLLCAVQMAEETGTDLSVEHVEETGGAELAEISSPPTSRAELAPLVETAALLTVQPMQKARETEDPLEVIASGVAEAYSTSAVPWESLYPEHEPLEISHQLLDFLEQETQSSMPSAQEMENPPCAEHVEISEVLRQLSDAVFGELEREESMESDAESTASETEPQHSIMQQTEAFPEEPLTCAQTTGKQEAEVLCAAPSLSEVLGNSGEREAENVEA